MADRGFGEAVTTERFQHGIEINALRDNCFQLIEIISQYNARMMEIRSEVNNNSRGIFHHVDLPEMDTQYSQIRSRLMSLHNLFTS